MITAADFEFHDRDPSISNWAETIVLIFQVPEARILGNAYIIARPNIGLAATSVILFQGFCPQPYQLDFIDARMHLPCPPSFLNQQYETGLTMTSVNAPRDFRFTYQDPHGAASFELDFAAIHNPFDTHDPKENPLVAAGEKDMGYGDAWANGHLDAVGHVTGSLELRGKQYAVDCYSGMDRSWGPREEWGGRAVTWLHVPFGPHLAIHIAQTMDVRDGRIVYDQMRFGYVVQDDETYGLVDARIEAERMDMMPMSNHVWCRDERGNEYEFRGQAVAASPWYQFIPAYVCFHTLMRYEHPEYGVAHAEMGDIFGMDWLGDRISRHARHPAILGGMGLER